MKITLGFSPCPNDTFIFDALVNHKIDTEGIDIEVWMEDVETLNRWALKEKLSVTKISYGALPLLLNNYAILNSGSALGKGVGPLLIQNKNTAPPKVDTNIIAIPGEYTTAHLLFSLAYPQAKNKIFLRYNEIEDFVLQNKGLGVIIHENRFTYEEKGLKKIVDLGDYWEEQTHTPIPLGGIAIRKGIDVKIQQQLDRLIKKSITYSFANYPKISDFVKRHAQEMDETVMRKHIDLYVNNYSMQLGEEGKSAIKKLMQIYEQLHHTNINYKTIFND